MKKVWKRLVTGLLCLTLLFYMLPEFFGLSDALAETAGNEDLGFSGIVMSDPAVSDGYVSGTISVPEGYDLATVRYYTDAESGSYAFAKLTYSSKKKQYTYRFALPYEGFDPVISPEKVRGGQADASASIIAECFSTEVWDGALDLTWYNESDTGFHLKTPAQLAGLSAIVNGSIDCECRDYMIKGDSSLIVNEYNPQGSLPAGVVGPVYMGIAAHDFSDRVIYLDNDMDMGGCDGSEIIHTGYNDSKNQYDYPNWTPIGGEYLMNPDDQLTMSESHFNGVIDGQGHKVENIYCYRYAYPKAGTTAYAYAQGTGFIGMMGTLYDGEEEPSAMPGIRNLSVSGYIFGRRMVGGLVGAIGGGSNAVSGDSVEGGVFIENAANHCYVYNTDSKGIGGIVGCSMAYGSIINCYNDGQISTIYTSPAGGIVGTNEHMDIYCCYNRGKVNTNGSKYGRGIGGTGNSPGSFTVSDCYFLTNSGDDPTYPGYYTYNLPKSCHVEVTSLSKASMTDGTLLKGLNVNGQAYTAGPDAYPILYWEAYPGAGATGTGSLYLTEPEGGSVWASKSGSLANGTVSYLSNRADQGYNFRYYTLNGNKLTGDYVTVNGSSEISAYMESSKAGIIRIPSNGSCQITVVKTGYIRSGGSLQAVTGYEVNSGDEIFEGDVLTVKAKLRSGVVPVNPDYDYKASVGMTNAYRYYFTYTDTETVNQVNPNFTVGSKINEEGVTLTLEVSPEVTPKLWSSIGDTGWYSEAKSSFTIKTAAQLAGLDKLVEEGNSFAGKTIYLGKDISLANTDGSGGIRSFNGIGNSSSGGVFAGTFDGKGHKITDLHGIEAGLFASCKGSENDPAIIRNVSVYGTCTGQNACAIAGMASWTQIENCKSYVVVNQAVSYAASILAYDKGGSVITDCINYASLSGTGKIGGIVGSLSSSGSVSNVLNYGNITVSGSGNNQVGGIAGILEGSLSKAGNYGSITASGRNIGGLVGQASASCRLSDSYNVGSVTYKDGSNTADSLGGIIGYGLLYTMERCYNYGKVVKESGSMTANIGSVLGRDGKNSRSAMTDVFSLSTANSDKYVCRSTTLAKLLEEKEDYYGGIREKSKSSFASASSSGVLRLINENQCFVLSNGKYPELSMTAEVHVHEGGCASCIKSAICSVCGLSYGSTDKNNHENTEIRNQSDPVWVYDGYSGDLYCSDCGSLLQNGELIAANKSEHALTVYTAGSYKDALEIIRKKDYTKEEADLLKTVDSGIAYSYGAESSTMMVSTEYVTIEALIKDMGYGVDEIEGITVTASSSEAYISMEVLENCSRYFDANGKAYAAPAALAISYANSSGTLAQVAAVCQVSDQLRFGYGMSDEQYKNKENLGGKRCLSPVLSITLHLKAGSFPGDVNRDGSLSAWDVTLITRYVKAVEAGKDASLVISDAAAVRNADCNGDGSVDMDDAMLLARYLAKIIDHLNSF